MQYREIDHLDGILYINSMVDEHVFSNESNEKISVGYLPDLTSNRFGT